MDSGYGENVASDFVETDRSVGAEEIGGHLAILEETTSIGQAELAIRYASIDEIEVGEGRFGIYSVITWRDEGEIWICCNRFLDALPSEFGRDCFVVVSTTEALAERGELDKVDVSVRFILNGIGSSRLPRRIAFR